MSNWTDYVKNYSLKHGITYGEALRKAAPSYRKMSGGVVLGGRKRKSKPKSGSKTIMGGKKRSMKKKTMSSGTRMVGGKRRMMKPLSKTKHKQAYGLGMKVGKVLGGKQPKGALAALLSGLNANIKVD